MKKTYRNTYSDGTVEIVEIEIPDEQETDYDVSADDIADALEDIA